MAHEAFHYQSLADVRSTSDALGTSLPLSEDLSALFPPDHRRPYRQQPHRLPAHGGHRRHR